MRAQAAFALVLLSSGCLPMEDLPDARPCAQPSSPTWDGEVPYKDDHLLCVHVEMDPDDFEELATNTRNAADIFGNTDCNAPFPAPYEWYEADIVVDGVAAQDVGIRTKGFLGSINPDKPSLKIKTDKFVDEQLLDETERITLNNNSNEVTRLRTCLAYDLFKRADVPAPKCNLAVVMVNDVPFGVYTHLEPIKKKFLRRTFGSDDGDLYEGTLTDVVEGWYGRFAAKTSDTDPTMLPLRRLEQTLAIVDEDAFVDAIDEVLDVEEFLRFWGVELILNHADGYSGNINNYWVYFDPNDDGRAHFIPWSVDMSLTEEGIGGSQDLSAYTRGRVVARMTRSPALLLRMKQVVEELLDDVYDTEELLEDVDDWSKLVVQGEVTPFYEEHLDELRSVIRQRPRVVREMLEGGIPVRGVDVDTCAPFAGRDTPPGATAED
mgnify:CR=1 FL=1